MAHGFHTGFSAKSQNRSPARHRVVKRPAKIGSAMRHRKYVSRRDGVINFRARRQITRERDLLFQSQSSREVFQIAILLAAAVEARLDPQPAVGKTMDRPD